MKFVIILIAYIQARLHNVKVNNAASQFCTVKAGKYADMSELSTNLILLIGPQKLTHVRILLPAKTFTCLDANCFCFYITYIFSPNLTLNSLLSQYRDPNCQIMSSIIKSQKCCCFKVSFSLLQGSVKFHLAAALINTGQTIHVINQLRFQFL